MSQYKPGDQFEVTDRSAPFHGVIGTVTEIEHSNPFCVVGELEVQGKVFPCCYKESEIMPIAVMLVPPVTETDSA